jgi:hypothetical protein
MARPLRINFAGAIYHVMSRANARQSIVRDDADRDKRVRWIRKTVEREEENEEENGTGPILNHRARFCYNPRITEGEQFGTPFR